MINKTYDLKHISETVKNNLPFFYLLTAFFTGLLLAVIYTVKMTDGKNLQIVLMQTSVNFQNVAQYVFIINLLCMLLFFVNGFSMIGKPFTIALLFIYGFSLGTFLITFFMQQNGENLLFFFLFFILPAVFYSIAQISACVQSVFFSSDLYYNYFKNAVIKTKIRTYLKRYILIIILICSGGVCMSIVAAVFIRFVS